MARKEINVGTSPNKGDGDPLRTAFRKINENFAELYTGNFAEPDVMTSTLAPDTDGIYDLGKSNKRWADLYVKDFIYLNGSRIELTSNGTLLINGGPPAERQDTVGSVFADDSTVMVDGIAGKVVGPVDTTTVDATIVTATNLNGLLTGNVVGNVTGDVKGSVFADDSTVIINGTENSINLDGTVKGNIIPDADEAYDIGSMTHKFRDLYLSGSTINLGGVEITNDGGVITFGGEKVVVEGGTGDVKGSVFGDDSTLLVDGVAGKIVGDIQNNLIETNNITALPGDTDLYIQGGIDSGTPGNPARVNIGTTNTSTIILGASDSLIYVNGNDDSIIGGGTGIFGTITGDLTGSVFSDGSSVMVDAVNNTLHASSVNAVAFQGGLLSNGGENSPLLITSGLQDQTGNTIFINPQGSDTLVQMWGETVNLVTGPYNTYDSPYMQFKTEGAFKAHQGAYFVGNLTGNVTGDLTGSVFADDSTLLVDGVNGKITGEVTGTISSTNWMAASDSYLTISNGGSTGPGPIQIVASANLNLSSGTNNDINITPHGSGRVKVSDGAFGIVEAANFIGHADQTMYLSSKTTTAESTHITLNSTSGVATTMYGDVTMQGSFTPPMLTQAEIDALTPTLGMMVYNTTTGKFQGYAADANNDSTTGWADLH